MDSEVAENGDFDAKLEQLFDEMYAIRDERDLYRSVVSPSGMIINLDVRVQIPK